MSPELQGLLLAFFFFAANIWDAVIHHFRPCGKRLACTGNGLIGTHKALFHAERLHQRVKRRHIALQGTVGFHRDEPALRAKTAPLERDNFDVTGIDLWHHHRHVRGKAVRAVV